MNEPKKRGRPPKQAEPDVSASIEYARRVFAGISPDVKYADSLERVNRALAGQGLPDIDSLELLR